MKLNMKCVLVKLSLKNEGKIEIFSDIQKLRAFTTYSLSLKYYHGICLCNISKSRDFPGGTVVKNLPANAGDMGVSPGLGRYHMLWSN